MKKIISSAKTSLLIVLCIILYISIFTQEKVLNVKNLGAVADGNTVNTEVIQKAIDSAHALGGGTVYFPAGEWMTGKIFMKNNVVLDISPEATLLAAPGPIYGEPEGSLTSLIYGEQLENITITGGGVIEGKTGITRDKGQGLGRRIIGLKKCKNVKITNVTLTHGGGCTLMLHSVDSLEIGNVKVLSFFSKDPNGGEARDAVNMDGSSNVYIHDTEIRGSDDAFAFKARTNAFMTTTENVRIERCVFASRTCNAIQFGSETNADFRNIVIKDCKIEHAGKAGIGITMNDGHIIENVRFENITMSNVCTPFYIGMTTRTGVGTIRDISFENIKCTNISSNPEYSMRSPKGYWVSTINGLTEMPVENVTFKNVSLHYKGGVTEKAENISPADSLKRYEPRRMGLRPACGFYVRHAKNIEFHNLTITLENPDMRPPIVLDDTENITFSNLDFPANDSIDYQILTLRSADIKVDDKNLVIKKVQ